MDNILIYSLKTGACLAVFYLFFKLLLSRDTFHRLNRIVVLGAVVLSFALPVCVITIYKELPAMPDFTAFETVEEGAMPAAPAPKPFPWRLFGGVVFAGGAVMMLSHTLISICGVLNLVRTGRREKQENGTVLVLLPQAVTPFSWWKYIVMSEADYAENGSTIIMHERAHLRLHHSLDLIVTDIAGCMQWFNPAMWLLRRELRAIHEYEADEAVLDSGVDARQYQMLLIKKAAGGRWYSIANSFNHSKLKNRITMMLQTKSSRWAYAKTLMVLPLTMLALGAFARTAYVIPDDKGKKEMTEITVHSFKSADGDKQPLYIVDGKEVEDPSTIPANRIKSVDVRKDGSQLAPEYAEKARNGAILITLRPEGEEPSGDGKVTIQRTVKNADGSSEVKVMQLKRGEMVEQGDVLILDGSLKGEPVRIQGAAGNVIRVVDNAGDLDDVVVVGYGANKKASAIPDALYIVDGREISKAEFNNFPSNKIQSLSVYKDETAVKMYGEKARKAGGVIVISTKKQTREEKLKGYLAGVDNPTPEQLAQAEADLQLFEERAASLKAKKAQYTDEEWKIVAGDIIAAENKILATVSRDGKTQVQTMTVTAANPAQEGLISAAKGVAAAKSALDMTKDHMSPEEYAQAKEQVAQAEAELAAARKELKIETHMITIRGNDDAVRNVKKGEEPLLVIDGKETPYKKLKDLQPGDIKTMNVLKDKTATEKYGKKAKNGVIEITTRK